MRKRAIRFTAICMSLCMMILVVVPVIHTVSFGLVGEDSHRGSQHLGGACDVAPGVFQGVDDHLGFQVGHGLVQGGGGKGA